MSFSSAIDLHLSKALFSLSSDKLQLHCFLGLEVSFCFSFFYSRDQPTKAAFPFGRRHAKRNAALGMRMTEGLKVAVTSDVKLYTTSPGLTLAV